MATVGAGSSDLGMVCILIAKRVEDLRLELALRTVPCGGWLPKAMMTVQAVFNSHKVIKASRWFHIASLRPWVRDEAP